MKFSSPLILSLAAAAAHANPIDKRQGVTDADILNYALTLEHLEATFYEQGLKNYTKADFMAAGAKDPLYENLQSVAADEKTHEEFLTSALSAAGAKPVERCTYAFPATDAKSFLALGSMLEGVGVSAYLGAAAKIMNSTYLTAAGSILTVEARHSAYLRAALGESPAPQPFDDPLDFNEVYTLASPFIVSCPKSNPMLPVKAFPTLTMEMSGMTATTGSTVKLMAGSGFEKMNATNVHAAFITVTGPVWATTKSQGDNTFMVTIPKGVAGQSYVVLTRGDSQATDDTIVAGPAIVEIGSKGMATGTSSSMSSMSSGVSAMGGMGSMGSKASASASMSPGASSSSSSSMPMFTGGASKTMSGAAGALGVGAFAAAAAVMM